MTANIFRTWEVGRSLHYNLKLESRLAILKSAVLAFTYGYRYVVIGKMTGREEATII